MPRQASYPPADLVEIPSIYQCQECRAVLLKSQLGKDKHNCVVDEASNYALYEELVAKKTDGGQIAGKKKV